MLKLEKLLETQTTEFNIQTDEYFVNKQRVDENLAIKTKFDGNLSQLKHAQRILFRETNELTKQMDALEPLMDVYEEKLEVIDPNKKVKIIIELKKNSMLLKEKMKIAKTKES